MMTRVIWLASILLVAAGCDPHRSSVGSVGTAGDAAAAAAGPVIGQWASYDVMMTAGAPQAEIPPEIGSLMAYMSFFRADNDAMVAAGVPLASFVPGNHPNDAVQSYWVADAGADFPYVGKAPFGRGEDATATNSPAPLGVRDMQCYPGDQGLVVATFLVPAPGVYGIKDLAVRRISTGGLSVTFKVFDSRRGLLASLRATNDRRWVTDAKTYGAGRLLEGDRLYFAVDRDADPDFDSTTIVWSVVRTAN